MKHRYYVALVRSRVPGYRSSIWSVGAENWDSARRRIAREAGVPPRGVFLERVWCRPLRHWRVNRDTHPPRPYYAEGPC